MKKLAVSVIVAIFMGYLSFGGLTFSTARDFYMEWAYYFVLVGFVIWIYKFLSLLPSFRIIKFLGKRHFAAILTAVVLSCSMFYASKPDLRILADETNLLSIAQSMYEDHSIVNTTMKYCFNGNYSERLAHEIDKRPLLYPLSISFLHSCLGYSYKNAFLLNGICICISLWLIYFLSVPYLGRFWGFCTMLFSAAFPIIVLYTTSAGFDIFNMMWALIMFAAIRLFFKNKTAKTAEFALYSALMLAQTRYESATTVILVIPFILYFMKKAEYKNLTFFTVIYPVFMLPVVLLNKITYSPNSLQVDSLENAFSFSHMFKNIKLSVPFFLGSRFDYGMPSLIMWLSIAGLLIVVYKLIRRSLFDGFCNVQNLKALSWFVFLFSIIHAGIKFAYYWGNFTIQFCCRHGIVFIPIIAFIAVYALKLITENFKVKSFVGIMLPIFLIFYGWSAAGQNLSVREIILYREFKAVKRYLETYYPNKNDYLLVAPVANLYVPFGYSVISHIYFNNHYSDIMQKMKYGMWSKILVVQKVSKQKNIIASETKLTNKVNLKNLYEKQIINDNVMRVSIVK